MSTRASCPPGANTASKHGCGGEARIGCVHVAPLPSGVNLPISQPGAAVPHGTSDATAGRSELRNPLTIDGKSMDRPKCYGYLDIETTGFSSHYCDLTVVGVAVLRANQQRFGQLFGGQINADNVLGLLEGADEIYTYNGSRFDLPFIKGALGLDLRKQFAHTDLMYSCWRKDLKGGLKAVEVRLGIERRLADMNGFMAVRLWWDYVNNNDREALQRLLEYNREDVLNLHVLRERLGVR
jgi:uncharacterized protein YprB with RNaseH-like and TPR domain